ncbi:MAG: DUF1800 domain-containing protein [Gammaproteobacteria bacterium]|nr:DUF1800 domain-containing protein [Gammaproteobacteria bacterium]
MRFRLSPSLRGLPLAALLFAGAPAHAAEPAPTPAEAARFLTQASFGADDASIAEVQALGYAGWLDAQLALPASRHRPRLDALGREITRMDRVEAWWYLSLRAPDQLRQRLAFALSELFVVSDKDSLAKQEAALASYYDLLADNAFGNYRSLMEQVTLSPIMGEYLSMLGNEKAQPEKNIRPDENFARELMQLFSIGLVQLDPDGTVKKDGMGASLPTYDQPVIEGYARVFTGWTFGNAERFRFPRQRDYVLPMKAWPAFHEPGEKTLLDGQVLPAGQTPEQDLAAALDSIFQHANVGPFVSRQLIQRLASSNPSPAYVARVAAVFDDNGQGVRGDLGAVVRAILLDPEARDGAVKLKEPVLRLSQLWRAFHAQAGNGRYLYDPDAEFLQSPLRANSVFNFFSPFYVQPGDIAAAGLVSPEFQILNESSITQTTNRLLTQALWRYQGMSNPKPEYILLDIARERALAGDIAALSERLNQLLLAGRMSDLLRSELARHLATVPATKPNERVTEALSLIVTSPEYAIQH